MNSSLLYGQGLCGRKDHMAANTGAYYDYRTIMKWEEYFHVGFGFCSPRHFFPEGLLQLTAEKKHVISKHIHLASSMQICKLVEEECSARPFSAVCAKWSVKRCNRPN